MTVLEGPEYQAARDRIKGNPVISMMAAGIAAVPLAQIAHEDGTPHFEFMQQANRAFDDAQARNAGNPGYEPYPAGAPRHLGLVAEAVLAERAAIREAVGSAMAAPGTSPESTSLSSQRVEVLAAIFPRARTRRVPDGERDLRASNDVLTIENDNLRRDIEKRRSSSVASLPSRR